MAMTAIRPLKWALIGASDIAATRMIPAMRAAEHEIEMVHSSDPARGEAFAAAHGIPTAIPDLEVLRDSDVDAVYVSTTNDLHRRHVEAAARAGKHVLCEKPLAASVPDALAIVSACASASVVLATNHHQRNAATIRAMARLVASGAIGQPLAVRLQHAVLLPERLRGWRLTHPDKGGGVILDITVHDVDTVRFVLGREAREVIGFAADQSLATTGIEDAAAAVIRFDDDILVSTFDAFTTPNAGTALEVHGTEGSLLGTDVLTQDPIGEVVLRRGTEVRVVDVGEHENLYIRGLRDFAAAVSGVDSTISTGADGLRALATAVAVSQAARSGQRVPVPVFDTAGIVPV